MGSFDDVYCLSKRSGGTERSVLGTLTTCIVWRCLRFAQYRFFVI